MMTFKEFIEHEELTAEELGFGREGRSTFSHYLLLRLLFKMQATEDLLSDLYSILEVDPGKVK